jgi:photosystem II stability/assembly factor-like uncharacterized protein
MNRAFALTSFAGIALLASLLMFAVPERDPAGADDWTVAEQTRLEKALLHAEPGSARAFKLQTKLDRLAAWRADQPQPGFPDEFNRVLYEMKIPSDRTTPAYRPGYQFRERANARIVRPMEKALTWHSRGPGNVAGRARGIVVDPDDPTGLTWFIAAVGGGIWYTADGGANWTELTDDVPNLAVQSIAMAPSNTDVIYVGTGESFYNVDTMNGNGMLKSTDKGLTWAPVASTLGDPRFNNVSRILVSPTDPDLVVVSTTTGTYKASLYPTSSIFRSTDGGASWTEVHTETGTSSFGGPRILQLVADPTDFDVQYATKYAAGIMKSTDAGQTWTDINNGITDLTGRFELAVSPVNTGYLFASAEGASHSELWVSWDAGATWNETVESGSEPNWLGAQGWYDNTIVCHPTDPTIVYVGGPELWKIDIASVGSTSRTTTRMASYSFPHPDHHGLAIVQDGGGWWILGTNDGGITRTASGESGFTMPIDGMTTTQFYGVDKRPGASAYFGGMQDNGTWYSGDDPTSTTPWTFAIGGDGYETSWHFDDPLKMMGGYQYNGLQRSLDGGLSWTSATTGMSDVGSGNAPFITKIGKSAQRPDDVFAVGASGVWYSTDFGGSWNLANLPGGQWGGLSSFHDVRVSHADPDVVWAGSRMDGSGDIFVSTDGGVNFAGVNQYSAVTLGRISGLATDPFDANTAYVLFSYAERPKVIKTTDQGATWTDISGFGTGSVSTNGFPDVAVYDLMVFPNDANHIWVGSEIGLIESLDGGATWGLADNGLPAVGVWKLAAIEDEIVLATHGRGIWTTTDPTLLDGSTYNPLFENAVQVPAGDLHLEFNLRSAYDSTQVWIDGAVATTFGPNTVLQAESLDLPVLANGTRTIFARGYVDGGTYDSVTRSVDVTVLAAPAFEYANVLTNDIDADDFQRNGFVWSVPGGFSDGALHTTHPYPNGASYTAMLLTPIRVSELTTLSFDEVAIVEPGEPGSVYGDSDFWDYVTVEGTVDGVHWSPLASAWDARDDAAWLSAYNGGGSGTSSMFRTRNVVLNDTFSEGQTVLLRFRLFADGYVVSWGWAVDNILISSQGVSAAGDVPSPVALDQNYPNPFNPRTTIRFSTARAGAVKLQVYDLRGRLVRTLVDESRPAGPYSEVWDGRDNRGSGAAAGIYFYRLETGGQVLQQKMTLLK